MSDYNFKEIEKKWKDKWFTDNIYQAEDFSDKEKKYILVEFPYPSGKSMHIGHMLRYTVPEIYSRYLRMRGYNVLFPMGWDAFGLPAENNAIKTGRHPAEVVAELVEYYRASMQDMGYAIDWSREINTTDPNYYKWTQWIFLRLYEKGLAELREEPVWWSDKMKSVLAEEEVYKDENGNLLAERDDSPVVRKMLKQWVLKMPEYSEKLLEGLDEVDFTESIKASQRNWIGKSIGAIVKFPIVHTGEKGSTTEAKYLEAFTTRIDTIFGVTFVVIAPEHEILEELLANSTNREEVEAYIKQASTVSDLDRISSKDKSGIKLEGVKVQNPFDPDREIDVYVANYVLRDYGTGIVMGVPAHDERDLEFARKYGIDVIPVISADKDNAPEYNDNYECFDIYGYVVNSGQYTGMSSEDAQAKMIEWLEANELGSAKTTYKMRDWLFSRQRYWGEPIPLIHHEDGKVEAIANSEDPESYNKHLPLRLPDVPNYEPTDDGASPLAANVEWVETTAPDGTPAQRETNTMPNWAGSCWYYIRYLDPHNDKSFADMKKMKYWLPVDMYFGGGEHTTRHLLYSRFWHKFLFDEGEVPTSEPYKWRMNGGILLGPDGAKMSKSKGNVVEPQEKLEKYGADAVRMYIAFIGPYDGTFPYSESSLKACARVVESIYGLRSKVSDEYENESLEKEMHKMIKNVTEMAESFKMNTIVSEIMIFVKKLKEAEKIPTAVWKDFLKITAPVTPFLAEELWHEINDYQSWDSSNSIHLQDWPEFNPELILEDQIEIPVQINGKLRGTLLVSSEVDQAQLEELVKNDDKLSSYVDGQQIRKFIYIEKKVVNIVI